MESCEVDLELFYETIEKYDLMNTWRIGVYDDAEEGRANKKAKEAKGKYIGMMSSSSNDGSGGYKNWAIQKSLRIKLNGASTGYGVKASTTRKNKGLN